MNSPTVAERPANTGFFRPRSSKNPVTRSAGRGGLRARHSRGMLSKDTHATTGEMWGNYPQTLSMVGLFNAAVRLSAA